MSINESDMSVRITDDTDVRERKDWDDASAVRVQQRK